VRSNRKHVQKGYLMGKVGERAKIKAEENVTRFTVSLILTYVTTKSVTESRFHWYL
jgi:hypothetical protein